MNVGGYSVLMDGYTSMPITEVDLSGNYWGTTESDSIEAWIYDYNDSSPSAPYAIVNYEPFSTVPLPTKKTTLGGLRARFR